MTHEFHAIPTDCRICGRPNEDGGSVHPECWAADVEEELRECEEAHAYDYTWPPPADLWEERR